MVMEMEKNEKNKTNYTLTATAGTIAIVMTALALFLVAGLMSPLRHEEPPDMFLLFLVGTGLSIIMFILSIFMIYIYFRDYLELRSKFTFGILLMMVALMLFSLTSMPFIHNFFGVFGRPGIFTVVPYLFATVSLAILAWLSSK